MVLKVLRPKGLLHPMCGWYSLPVLGERSNSRRASGRRCKATVQSYPIFLLGHPSILVRYAESSRGGPDELHLRFVHWHGDNSTLKVSFPD